MIGFKKAIIFILVFVISILHIQTAPSEYGLHILHGELFIIPIVLASFWFGLWPGLGVAIFVCAVYAPLAMNHGEHYNSSATSVIILQLMLFLLLSILLGWLRNRLQNQHEKLVAGEQATVLARAAAALSFEIRDVVNCMDKIHVRASGFENKREEENYQQEIIRLRHLVEILSRYSPEKDQQAISIDLNELLRASYQRFKQQARNKGVEIVLQLDPTGCPTMIVSEAFQRTIDNLVQNALEASAHGQRVFLRSQRGGTACQLEVADEGKGVAEKDLDKLFTPFFTTKPHGSGLALAAGKKVLRDHGGDLVYSPGTTSGAVFKMIVPRENERDNVDEFARIEKLQ